PLAVDALQLVLPDQHPDLVGDRLRLPVDLVEKFGVSGRLRALHCQVGAAVPAGDEVGPGADLQRGPAVVAVDGRDFHDNPRRAKTIRPRNRVIRFPDADYFDFPPRANAPNARLTHTPGNGIILLVVRSLSRYR